MAQRERSLRLAPRRGHGLALPHQAAESVKAPSHQEAQRTADLGGLAPPTQVGAKAIAKASAWYDAVSLGFHRLFWALGFASIGRDSPKPPLEAPKACPPCVALGIPYLSTLFPRAPRASR